MDRNRKILIGILVLVFIGGAVFLLTQPSDFVKKMTKLEKTELESLSTLASSVEIPYDSIPESQKTHYIGSLDELYNSTYALKKSFETNNYTDEKYKAYINAQLAFLDVYLLTINNTKQYYLTGDENYANLVIMTNKTIRPPHISDLQ